MGTKKAIKGKVSQTPLLVQFARLIFENNFIKSEFSSDIYHQNFGIAMGTSLVITAANMFMHYHERDIVQSYSRYLALYKRFIDDLFVIWDVPREILLEFLLPFNTKDEHIKITYEISECKISFLDLMVALRYIILPFRNRLISTYIFLMSHFTPIATKKLSSKASLC